MKEYFVTLPATVALNIRVEAESVDDAIEKAFGHPFGIMIKNDPNDDVIIDDFQLHRIICEGNYCHASLNEFDVEEGENLEENE